MLEPRLVMGGGLASKAFAERQSPHSRIDTILRIDLSTAGLRRIESHPPKAWLMMSRFTHGNLTSILKVLDGKSQLQLDTVRYFDNWRDSGQSHARAPA